jgi:DNA-binding SARP family transcriptional activator
MSLLESANRQRTKASPDGAALYRLIRAGDRAAAMCLLVAHHRIVPESNTQPAGVSPERWRAGLRRWMTGHRREAVTDYVHASAEPADATPAHCLAAVWYWDLGDHDASRAAAKSALSTAEHTGAAADLAAAHRAAALCEAGPDDSADHHRTALSFGPDPDPGLMRLILSLNRAAHTAGDPAQADVLAGLDAAGPGRSRHLGFEPFALSIGAAAKLHQGRLEEALTDSAAAHRLHRVLGTACDTAFLYAVLGRIHLRRREHRQAREALEAALHAGADTQPTLHVEVLSALARVRTADNPGIARELAERAVGFGADVGRVRALLARGWVALVAGDRDQAACDAAEARTGARKSGQDDALAEALEMMALTTPAARSATGLLSDAAALRRSSGDVVGEAENLLVTARRRGDWPGAERAEERLRRSGVRLEPGIGDAITVLTATAPRIGVRTLGEFRVYRDGTAVASGEWQSKKARDLLKILIAHRGRPVPRQRLAELLWPEQSSAPTGNRLSVLLTILRRVLDPQRQISGQGPIVADRTAVQLDLRAVDLDVERYFAMLDLARGSRGHDPAGTMTLLRAAADLYRGDFLADDPYEDWTHALREETTTSYVGALRDLAALTGDTDEKVHALQRIIHCEPYDEPAHLDLVRVLEGSGRHGEAQRHYQSYVERMAELGLDPASVTFASGHHQNTSLTSHRQAPDGRLMR